MVKICVDCRKERPHSDFHKSGRGLRANCKECRSYKDRSDKLRRHYGITQEQYDSLLERQQGVCRICKQGETLVDTRTGFVMSLAIDHDHSCCPGSKTCGQCIRGLLCFNCNTALGLLDDNVDLLVRSILYLRRHIEE